jgi:hypothetical protein
MKDIVNSKEEEEEKKRNAHSFKNVARHPPSYMMIVKNDLCR